MGFIASLSSISPWMKHDSIALLARCSVFPLRTSPYTTQIPNQVVCCSSPKSYTTTEQDILKFVSHSDGKSLPCVRTYENDLVQLSLVGAVGFEQALTAAAADGGEAAAEHFRDRLSVMVVETLFPGGSDPHSTVATRLFLPTEKVKEKAKKLRRSLTEDLPAGAVSQNILAMTFRQVVLRKLWKHQLTLFRPGTERDMEDLQNPREVPASITLSSSDERIISVIAEVLCAAALKSTERHFLNNYLGKIHRNPLLLFQKHEKIASKDSSVFLYRLLDEEIVEKAISMLDHFWSIKENFQPRDMGVKYGWYSPSIYARLKKIGGPAFCYWSSEYVPAYKLVVDPSRFQDLKFEGWTDTPDGRQEVHLTRYQLDDLADIMDIYFEDVFSLPDKRLQFGAVANYADLPSKKRDFTLLKIIYATAVSGVLLIALSVLGQRCLSSKGGKSLLKHQDLLSSKAEQLSHYSSGTSEVERFCTLIVEKVKAALGWSGETTTVGDVGAWIGEVPNSLKADNEAASSVEDNVSGPASLTESENERSALQHIASYQVVLSTEGEVVGLQPTSRVGVNHWADNPLARELYRGRKLSPGFLEPGLKIQLPDKVVVVELVMSVNRDSPFALARPVKI